MVIHSHCFVPGGNLDAAPGKLGVRQLMKTVVLRGC